MFYQLQNKSQFRLTKNKLFQNKHKYKLIKQGQRIYKLPMRVVYYSLQSVPSKISNQCINIHCLILWIYMRQQ